MDSVEVSNNSPKDNVSAAKSLKALDKAMELPLVNSACTEVTRITSQLTPFVSAVKTQVEENVVPRIPSTVTGGVAKVVEKADHLACEGIDHLTEKVPKLKESTPKLLEDTKTTMSSYLSEATDYAASFPAAQVVLKITDSGLEVMEDVLKKVGSDDSGIKKIHCTANNIRISGVKRAGTERAKMIEDASILEALADLLGLNNLLSFLSGAQAAK